MRVAKGTQLQYRQGESEDAWCECREEIYYQLKRRIHGKKLLTRIRALRMSQPHTQSCRSKAAPAISGHDKAIIAALW